MRYILSKIKGNVLVFNREVGKQKVQYEAELGKLEKRCELKSLTSTVRPGGTKYGYECALETEFSLQNSAYIHLKWKDHPSHPMFEEV